MTDLIQILATRVFGDFDLMLMQGYPGLNIGLHVLKRFHWPHYPIGPSSFLGLIRPDH